MEQLRICAEGAGRREHRRRVCAPAGGHRRGAAAGRQVWNRPFLACTMLTPHLQSDISECVRLHLNEQCRGGILSWAPPHHRCVPAHRGAEPRERGGGIRRVAARRQSVRRAHRPDDADIHNHAGGSDDALSYQSYCADALCCFDCDALRIWTRCRASSRGGCSAAACLPRAR